MTLIKSISGIRGTIGSLPGENLTPIDIVKFTSAFGIWTTKQSKNEKKKIIVGRDARPSGEMVEKLVTGTLIGLGFDVVTLGMATTPTVEIAVGEENADGGIIITASHNPKEYNALKLLNSKGEFLNAEEGEEVLIIAENKEMKYAEVDSLGTITEKDYLEEHIQQILSLSLINKKAISKAKFKVVVDGINSVGGIVIPKLLKALGVKQVIELNCEPNGEFAHNPEPLPENLKEMTDAVLKNKAHCGIVVDPDVDRLAFVDEKGNMFGEEYTLVAVADYVLQNQKGNTVSNLSSTKALRELTREHGAQYAASAVGEVNVIQKMKENNSVIGGEGNGGVIYPELHYGRDALVGVGLFLTFLAKSGLSCSALREKYPKYHISKNKIQLTPEIDTDKLLEKLKNDYSDYYINDEDGVKIEFESGWVHLRKSNTEPIIRVYSEGNTREIAEELAYGVMEDIKEMTNK
ncbi:MAG: phosphoglucosamine mutase [Bacteroidota bacterium]